MTIPNALNSSKKNNPTGPAVISSTSSQPPGAGVGGKGGGPVGKTRRSFGCSACCGFVSGLILLGFVAAGLVVYRNHEAFNFSLFTGYHDGDQIVASRLARSFSSLLCQTYRVQAWADSVEGASFYLTDGPATIQPLDRQVVVIDNAHGLRSHEDFDYAAFHLLPGSVIETSACLSIFNEFPSVHADILVIKGTGHFNQWAQQDAACGDGQCVEHWVRISPRQLCEVGGRQRLTLFDVAQADTYYVVITRQRRQDDAAAFRADVTMKVTKTVYDVSQAKQKCMHASSCTFNLTYNTDDDIVVQFPYQNFYPEDPDNSFSTSCGIRMEFFLIIFVLFPACLIFLLTVLSCICCMQQDGPYSKPTLQQLQQKKAEAKAALTTPTTTDPVSQRETLPPV
ncbi:hypothetical protein ACOMHN_018245 [Nucella lapillus]